MADRYEYAQFSQPYMESGLVMVVPVKPNSMKETFFFIYAFTTKMWIILLTMTLATVSVVWFNEHVDNNKDFQASSTFEYITKMLWFAVAVLSLAHSKYSQFDLVFLSLLRHNNTNSVQKLDYICTMHDSLKKFMGSFKREK